MAVEHTSNEGSAVLAEDLADIARDAVEIRHDLHAHPELGGEEHRTSALVADHLREIGADEVVTGVGGTGVVATVRGTGAGDPTRRLGIRADMDALAIQERTGLGYASTRDGVMHACGHDGHTAIALGAARYLARHRDFAGEVRFVFQPAEELRDGAQAMIDDGLFDRFDVDAVYALHLGPGAPVGTLATTAGTIMAGVARWTVEFHGPGGHGGPGLHLAPDLTLAQSHFVIALQEIVTRSVAATETAAASVGYVRTGEQRAADSPFNVVPERIEIGGTLRVHSAEVGAVLERRLREVADACATLVGARARTSLRWAMPATVNPPDRTEAVLRAARGVLGERRVITPMPPVMAGEDFSLMLGLRPGALVFLTTGPGEDGAPVPGLHTATFDVDDRAVPAGIAYWAGLVAQELAPSR